MTDIVKFDDGVAFCCDSTSERAHQFIQNEFGDMKFPMIITDPPYGNVVSDDWDNVKVSDVDFATWMRDWTHRWAEHLCDGGSLYVWGGIGKPGFRPFFHYVTKTEVVGKLELANLITWKKKRAIGRDNNYLFTREELAWWVKGDAKKPRTFNVPLLDEKRGYPGYNKKYPAKSEFYRRTNVWTDVTEVMRNKVHTAQKAQRVIEVPIEVHTNPGEWVIDMFAGSGTTALAARKLGRKFVLFENDEQTFQQMVERLHGRE